MVSRDQASGDRCAHLDRRETVVEPEVIAGEGDGAVTVALRLTGPRDERRPRRLLTKPIDAAITDVETETPRIHSDATRNGHVWTISVSDNGIETGSTVQFTSRPPITTNGNGTTRTTIHTRTRNHAL